MNTKDGRGEVFTAEELEKMNNELKNHEGEGKTLPESLKKENIEKLIADVPQAEENETKEEKEIRTKKKRDSRLAVKVLAFAAAFAIVFTSLITVKPWRYTTSHIKRQNKPIPVKPVEDYTEIETLFANYVEKYQKAYANRKSYGLSGIFNMKSSSAGMAIDEASAETAAPGAAPGAANATAAAAPADDGSSAANEKNYGKTNEQVEGVHEADIIKTDGKYIYAVLPAHEDYEAYNNALVSNGAIVKSANLPHIKSQCAIAVFEVKEDGSLERAGTVTIAPEPESSTIYSMHLNEFYINGDRLTAVVTGEAYLDRIEREEPLADTTAAPAETLKAETAETTAAPANIIDEPELVVAEPGIAAAAPVITPVEPEAAAEPETAAAEPGEAKSTPGYNPDEAAETPPETEPVEDTAAVVDEPVMAADCYVYPYYNSKSVTMVMTCDISDIKNPKELSRTYQDGWYISSRNIGSEFVLITNYNINLYMESDAVIDNCVPKCGTGAENYKRIPNDSICIMEQVNDSRYLVASVFDINNPEGTLKSEAVLGGGENIYCTANTLYVTSSESTYTSDIAEEIFGAGSSDIITQLYKFDITGGDINYLASATVAGFALDQFSIDEKDGYLRIATSTGYWGKDVVNIIHVLDKDLKAVGTLGGIAKGEVIKAVRFSGDTAYVVTFEQTDPLFVIDLSNPNEPKITGELKLPGYSQYLHPVAENLLLGVGVDGDENGAKNGLKISLFDVSDPKNPVEADRFVVAGYDIQDGSSYSYCNISSAAQYYHKAFCFDSENGIVYIPYEKYENSWVNYGNYESNNKQTYGAYAFKIDTANKKLAAPTDYLCSSSENCYSSVERVTYVGETVICFSNSGSRLYSFNGKSAQMISNIGL